MAVTAAGCGGRTDTQELSCAVVLGESLPEHGDAAAQTVGVAVDAHAERGFVEDELGAVVGAAVSGGQRLVVGTSSDGNGIVAYDRDFSSTITGENATTESRRRSAAHRQLTERIDCLLDRLELGSGANPWPGARSVAERVGRADGDRSLLLVGPFVPAGREWDISEGGDIETETAKEWVVAMLALDGGIGPVEGVAVRGIGVGRGAGDARYLLAVRDVVDRIAVHDGAESVSFSHSTS